MTPPGPDPGSSPERTQLAWRRTVLASVAVTLLTARLAVHSGLSVIGGVEVLAALVLALLTGRLAARRIARLDARPPVPPARVWPLALAVVAHACLACLLVVLP